MPSRYALLAVAACYAQQWVVAQPQISFPISAQIPPVAVINEEYSFTFSAGTFSSATSISYALSHAPAWLRLDNATRTFVGKPESDDAGQLSITISATDADGTTDLSASLVVVYRSILQSRQDIVAERLGQAGRYSAPSTLLLQPQSAFVLAFGTDVFSTKSSSLHYYATSVDKSPLPAWISFDAKAVSFSGTTPSLLTPQSSPQTFAFSLAASEVEGYAEAVISFQIAVTNHVLTFLQPLQTVNASVGGQVHVQPLLPQLQRDGASVDRSTVIKVSCNQPEWLVLDSQDLSFSGIVPQEAENYDFRLAVIDDQNNQAVAEVQMLIDTHGLNSTRDRYLGTIAVAPGAVLDYSLARADIDSNVSDFEVDLGPAEPWLVFTKANLSLYGVVPTTFDISAFNISFTAKGDVGTAEVEHLKVFITGIPSSTKSMDQSSISHEASPTATSSTINASNDDSTNKHDTALALLIALPIVGVGVACLLAFLIWRVARRKRKKQIPASNQVSRPDSPDMRETLSHSSTDNIVVLADSPSSSELSPLRASPAPRIDVRWSFHNKPKKRLLSTAVREEADTPETRSSWEDMLLETENARDDELLALDTNSVPQRNKIMSSSLHGDNASRTKLTDRQVSKTSTKSGSRSGTLKFNGRRSSGFGHGTSMADATLDQTTMRRVPLSPLSEHPSGTTNPFHRQNPRSLSSSNSGARMKRTAPSTASSESRFAAPLECQPPLPNTNHRRRNVSNDHSDSSWDDDWTESSDIRSGNTHMRQLLSERSEGFAPMLAENGALNSSLSRLQGTLASAASHGRSFKSQQSEQSQSNSARFL